MTLCSAYCEGSLMLCHHSTKAPYLCSTQDHHILSFLKSHHLWCQHSWKSQIIQISWAMLMVDLNLMQIQTYSTQVHTLTSWIIVAASPYTTPIQTSSDWTLEQSGTPSGRMPFTAPIWPSAKLITFKSKTDFSALWIFSLGKTWKRELLVSL